MNIATEDIEIPCQRCRGASLERELEQLVAEFDRLAAEHDRLEASLQETERRTGSSERSDGELTEQAQALRAEAAGRRSEFEFLRRKHQEGLDSLVCDLETAQVDSEACRERFEALEAVRADLDRQLVEARCGHSTEVVGNQQEADPRPEGQQIVVHNDHPVPVQAAEGGVQGRCSPTGRGSLGPRRPWPLKLVTIVAIVLAASAGLISIVAGWIGYRRANVVSHNAFLKTTVANLGARIPGQVASIEVEPGQRVRKGDVLVRLIDNAQRASVSEAKSTLLGATHDLGAERLAIENEAQQLELAVSQAKSNLEAEIATVTAEEAKLNRAEREYKREVAMARKGLISARTLDEWDMERKTSEATLHLARANQLAAESALQGAEANRRGLDVRRWRLRSLEAQIEAARNAVARAEAELDATVIRAPEDGWVVRRVLEPGASVQVGQPILSMRIGNHVWVEAWIDESELEHIEIGGYVDIIIKAFPDKVLIGNVYSIGVLTDTEHVLYGSGIPIPQNMDAILRTPAKCRVLISLEAGGDIRLVSGLSAKVGIRKRQHTETRKVDGGSIIARTRDSAG